MHTPGCQRPIVNIRIISPSIVLATSSINRLIPNFHNRIDSTSCHTVIIIAEGTP